MKLSIGNLPEVQPVFTSLIKLKSWEMQYVKELSSTASDFLIFCQPIKFPGTAAIQIPQDIKSGKELQNNLSVPTMIETGESFQV